MRHSCSARSHAHACPRHDARATARAGLATSRRSLPGASSGPQSLFRSTAGRFRATAKAVRHRQIAGAGRPWRSPGTVRRSIGKETAVRWKHLAGSAGRWQDLLAPLRGRRAVGRRARGCAQSTSGAWHAPRERPISRSPVNRMRVRTHFHSATSLFKSSAGLWCGRSCTAAPLAVQREPSGRGHLWELAGRQKASFGGQVQTLDVLDESDAGACQLELDRADVGSRECRPACRYQHRLLMTPGAMS